MIVFQLHSLLSTLSLLLLLLFITQPTSTQSQSTITCGCEDCTTEILNTLAGAYPCGDRITYLINFEGYSELNACRKVAGDEFPFICGPGCNPDMCDDATPSPITPSPTYPPIPAPSSLYCFPDDDGVSRVTYSNMWNIENNNGGGMEVQVKEGNVCGPGDNRFSRNTVSRNNDDLTLQFKRNTDTNVWEASEVRVTLSNSQPFNYGNYTFHVKSVAVKDASGTTISEILPANIVLGLFTWDPTDRYEVHENWNHEVDIEISRWGIDTDADTQFLVQPPGSPQMYRFFSGDSPGTYQQSNQWHSFRWLPNIIYWESTAGGGHVHSYSTEQAIAYGLEDFVQCLPADVEIRLNLWSINGLNTPPKGLNDDEYVEVVIDYFAYDQDTDIQHASPGESCTKHCQCEAEQGCVNGKCIAPPSTCQDSTYTFRTKNKKTSKKFQWRNCTWVGNKPNQRCKWRDNWKMCPLTCNKCDLCKDPKAKMKFYEVPGADKKIAKKCSWTKSEVESRCNILGMKDTCRKTCGNCS